MKFENLNYIFFKIRLYGLYWMKLIRVEVPMDKESPGDRTYPARILVARL